MTKITKADLKAIVKECIIEILSEGLGNSLSSVKRPVTSKQDSPYLEEKRARPQKQSSQLPQLHEFIKKEAGGNKIMEDIFADTAASTLPKMLQGEGRGPSPVKLTLEERIVDAVEPEDIFGKEEVSKWADYAFANVTKK